MPPTTPITFRCPNSVVEAIDRIGRDRYPRSEGEGGVAKIDYDRTAAILDIINAGIAAIDEGFAPKQIERGVADQHSLDGVKQLIRQELERLLPELLEKHIGSAGKVASLSVDTDAALRQENERLREGIKALESRIDADRALEVQLRQERREDKDKLQRLETENLDLASQLQVSAFANACLEEEYNRIYRELAELDAIGATPGLKLPEPAELLNRLKSQRKRSKADLADVEAILEMLPSLPASPSPD